MTTILTQDAFFKDVTITLTLNGADFSPSDGYVLGVLQPGDKIGIGVHVDPTVDHRVYTLDANKDPKAKSAIKPGVYIKNLTVTACRSEKGVRSTQIAGWPNNMICLEIWGRTYNIGIFNRNGKYFFAIVKREMPIITDDSTPIGTVTRFDVLQGVGRIYTGDRFQETRLHWSKMPFRKNLGFRAVLEGEVIKFDPKSLVETGAAKTTFSKEIVKGVLVTK